MSVISTTRIGPTPMRREAPGLFSKLGAIGAEFGDFLRLTVQAFRFSRVTSEAPAPRQGARFNRPVTWPEDTFFI